MRSLLALASLLLGSACSSLSLEIAEPLDLETCASFEPGVTERADVLETLGPPVALAAHGDGVALLYEHVSLHERQFGISLNLVGKLLGAPGLEWIKVAFGGSGSERQAAVFVFDGAGVLHGSGVGTWEEAFGRGGTLQFLFNVEQVVDTGTMRAPRRGLTWGLELLESLPQTLNQGHRADLELKDSPGGAGQRSLEQVGRRRPTR